MIDRLHSSLSFLWSAAAKSQAGIGALRSRAAGVMGSLLDWGGPLLSAPSRRSRKGAHRRRRWRVVVLLIFLGVLLYELRTSAIQSWMLSRWAERATFSVQRGASGEVVYPKSGPFNERLGYTRLPRFRKRLEQDGFEIVEQAAFSPTLSRLARWGISPPFRDPVDVGLVVRGMDGQPLFDFVRRRHRFERYEDVPTIVVRTLLFLEDHQLGEPADPRNNPAVDWTRFVTSGARYVGRKVGLPMRVEGGSTLATQMEKYRHSPEGKTAGAVEKLKQMTAASLRVYREGPDTSEVRRQIILDYLNSMPLAAAPGYGEVNGLAEGLRVWFATEPAAVVAALEAPGVSEDKARALRTILGLLYAVRAPSKYLVRDREELADRVESYLRILRAEGVIDPALGDLALSQPLEFPDADIPAAPPPLPLADGKAVAAIRNRLVSLLEVRDLYALDRLQLDVTTTVDPKLQQQAVELLRAMADPEFVRANGLDAFRMLDRGDPSRVVYSLLLLEATDRGNVVRVHADSLRDPFDVNTGTKMELGSTAKLRTLVHYLDLVATLHADPTGTAPQAEDPITDWVRATLRAEPSIDVETLLERALDRTYSASPAEQFFTGGGVHRFDNFDPDDNGAVLTLREATVRSTNLVFVRLMRDIVRYHVARLPYDAERVLDDPEDPQREVMLADIADEEATAALRRAWYKYRDEAADDLVSSLLGRRAGSSRHLAMVYFAFHPDGDEDGLAAWLERFGAKAGPGDVRRYTRSYGGEHLTMSDYGWLLDLHPLEVWCASRLVERPGAGFDELSAESADVKRDASRWLLETRNRRAQDARLRTRIEKDAFDRVTVYWRRLGFPFERMVASYASSIGSSADRPSGLADLMGLLVNDGMRRPTILLDELRFAPDTPYYIAMRATGAEGERVIPTAVARVSRKLLADVVERGTARRLAGEFVAPDGTELAAGGKTGSGDNRHETYTASGQVLSSRPTSRTAAFVFFVGDRHFGVITAMVEGPESGEYKFTSSLPLGVLRLLAPSIAERAAPASARPATPSAAS
jgi:membrane peptidoglycan carboxypeptidase